MNSAWTYPDDVDYGIDGGYYNIYDGVIIWRLKDGRYINAFRSEGSIREQRVDELLTRWEREREPEQAGR